MPPKKQNKPSKKTEMKKKDKIIEDKTFGMKNKNKSKKVQKQINHLKQQARGGVSAEAEAAKAAQLKAEKKAKKKAEEEIASLFKVVQKKAPPGVDTRSVVCEFFRAGNCRRGTKCQYSHDLGVARKAEKMDLYTDPRELKGEEGGMDDWNQSQLEEVVNKKHATANTNATSIICKFFLDAVEKRLYGWFWECPNGTTCKYRHALPEGYILRPKESKKEEPEEEKIPLEEEIENLRAALPRQGLTPVTLETFTKWREEREKKRMVEVEATRKAEEAKGQGRGLNVLSGRDLFTFDPSLFVDDEGAYGQDDFSSDDESDDDQDQKQAPETDQKTQQEGDTQQFNEDQHLDEDLFLNEDVDLPDE